MVCFQTKNPNLGKFWRALDWKMFIYFVAIWNILWRFGIVYEHLVHFVFIWYIITVLVSCTNKNLATLLRTVQEPMELPLCTFLIGLQLENKRQFSCRKSSSEKLATYVRFKLVQKF
jgi:hypothetical protein